MKKVTPAHKNIVKEILSNAFDENKSVNWVIKSDKYRKDRIKGIVDYAFENCIRFGDVFLSDDLKACALVLYPEKKKTTLATIWLDIQLVNRSIGWLRAIRIMKREWLIDQLRPKEKYSYLWFIGVDSASQGKGKGGALLTELLEKVNKPIVLETSTLKNLPWYKKFGFEVYNELDDFGYKMFMMRKN